jgi:hypothetical protein
MTISPKLTAAGLTADEAMALSKSPTAKAVSLKSLSKLSSGDLRVRQQTKFKLLKNARSRSNSPTFTKRALAASLKRSPFFQENETIQWKNQGVTNEAWDRNNPGNNLGGCACFRSPVQDSSSTTSLGLLSPHVMQLLAREDFACMMHWESSKRSFSSKHKHQSTSAFSKPSCLRTGPKKARNAEWGNRSFSHKQQTNEITDSDEILAERVIATATAISIPMKPRDIPSEVILSEAESLSQVLSSIDLQMES